MMKQIQTRLNEMWQVRQPRERKVVIAAAVVLISATILQQLLPWVAMQWQQQQRSAALQSEVAYLKSALAARQGLPADCTLSPDQDWSAVAKQQGINISVVNPTTATTDQHWVAQAATGNALLSFAFLHSSCAGEEVVQGEITRLTVSPDDTAVAPKAGNRYRALLVTGEQSASQGGQP
ncbi:MAG: hypothetical protein ACN4EJ_04635 [Porticoccaceae bacterium]